jgi:hypothetical protein
LLECAFDVEPALGQGLANLAGEFAVSGEDSRARS